MYMYIAHTNTSSVGQYCTCSYSVASLVPRLYHVGFTPPNAIKPGNKATAYQAYSGTP